MDSTQNSQHAYYMYPFIKLLYEKTHTLSDELGKYYGELIKNG